MPFASNAQNNCRYSWLASPAQIFRKFLIFPVLCFGFRQWDACVGTWENGWSKSTLKTCDFSGNNEWRWIMKTLLFPWGWWSSGWGFLWSWEVRDSYLVIPGCLKSQDLPKSGLSETSEAIPKRWSRIQGMTWGWVGTARGIILMKDSVTSGLFPSVLFHIVFPAPHQENTK